MTTKPGVSLQGTTVFPREVPQARAVWGGLRTRNKQGVPYYFKLLRLKVLN